jgi:hypothetical protein
MPTFTLISQHTISADPTELLYIMILRFDQHWNKEVQVTNKINWKITITKTEAQYTLILQLGHFTRIVKIN